MSKQFYLDNLKSDVDEDLLVYIIRERKLVCYLGKLSLSRIMGHLEHVSLNGACKEAADQGDIAQRPSSVNMYYNIEERRLYACFEWTVAYYDTSGEKGFKNFVRSRVAKSPVYVEHPSFDQVKAISVDDFYSSAKQNNGIIDIVKLYKDAYGLKLPL